MNRWGVLTSVFLSFFLLSLVTAAENDTRVASDRAFACLENQVATKPSLALDEALFSVMALGAHEKALKVIDQEERKDSTGSCWPKGGCTIKQTAQALLALRQAGRSTTGAETWLLNKSGVATELAWYLEVDTEGQRATQCTFKYDAGSYTVRIGEDMKLASSAGSCLTLAPSGFLLRVRDSCLSKAFDISCNETFVTALLYQKDKGTQEDCLNLGNQTCFVSDSSHSSASLGTTREQVTAYCFKQGTACDYEGSLWATYALWKQGKDSNKYLPYLIALTEGHDRHFPSAFLFGLTGNSDYFSAIANQQKVQGYWELAGSPYNRYYDTALALLGLGSAPEANTAKDYLTSIQTREGCWNNNRIVDTGFLLYAGWGRGASGGGSGGSGSSAFCTEAGFSCGRQDACLAAGGVVKPGFECTGFGICCSVSLSEASCASQSGRVCSSTQTCSGRSVPSAEGSCCVDECIVQQVVVTESECELIGGSCSTRCDEGTEASTEQCSSSGDICCMSSDDAGSGTAWVWILFIAILIVLLVLGILYHEKLRLWYFSWRKGSAAPSVRPAPSVRAPTPVYRPMQRPISRPVARPAPAQGKPFSNELEETLKKLREMSK